MPNDQEKDLGFRVGVESTDKVNTQKGPTDRAVAEITHQQGTMRNVTGAQALDALEHEPVADVSFAEAVEQLNGHLDLIAARDQAVKTAEKYGITQVLIQKGVIQNAEEFSALFDGVRVSKKAIAGVKAYSKRPGDVLPIFDAGGMTPRELLNLVFANVPHDKNYAEFRDLERIRQIDPASATPRLDASSSWDQQLSAFRSAYAAAKDFAPTGPRLIFTPNELNAGRVDTSATQDLIAAQNGQLNFLDLNADLLRIRAQLDRGVIPDTGIYSRYPLQVLPSGHVLVIYRGERSREIIFGSVAPDRSDLLTGSRIMLG